MKSLTFAVAATVLVSLLTVSESGVTSLESKSFVDPIIKEILERLRPNFANLKIDDVNQVVKNPNINATIIVKKIIIQNLDKFVIQNLKSNLVPLKLTNLTLTWNDIVASAYYDFDVLFNIPKYNGPFHIFGKGDAKGILKDVFLTVGANLEMKNKVIQVKPKGLFGFDLVVKRANVTMTSMMGSTEFGDALGVFFSNIIPDLVGTLKKPVFNSFQDDIIKIINEVLKGKETFSGTPFNDENSGDYFDNFFLDSDESSEESESF